MTKYEQIQNKKPQQKLSGTGWHQTINAADGILLPISNYGQYSFPDNLIIIIVHFYLQIKPNRIKIEDILNSLAFKSPQNII